MTRSLTLTLVAAAALAAACGAPSQQSAGTAAPAEAGGSEGGVPGGSPAMGLTWTAPAGWVEEQPGSPMRKAQYRVPGGQGSASPDSPNSDGELTVFSFGPGQGGDAQANADRWAKQFRTDSGEAPRMTSVKMDVGGIPVLFVEVTGTYDGGMAMTDHPSVSKPGYMLLGAIVEAPAAAWFFKFTGPEATVRSQKAAFEGLIRSIKAVKATA